MQVLCCVLSYSHMTLKWVDCKLINLSYYCFYYFIVASLDINNSVDLFTRYDINSTGY